MFTKTLKLLVLVGALFFSYKSFAQPTFTIQNIKGACEGFPNGSFEVLVSSASGAVNISYFSGPIFGGPFPATVGTPITIPGLPGAPFPGRAYLLVVQDAVDFSTGNVNIISYPTPITITIDNVADNTDCVTSNGSISISPTGGSGSYTFEWTEASLGFSANTEDISNLLGGSYSLTITDNNTNCIESFPPIVVDNPSPILFQLDVTPNPLPICSGSNLVLSLDGSEVGATYEVYRNNVTATGITQVGTGAPLNFTVPSGTFANGDNFKIRATNGICQGDMQGALIVSILPLPTASISGSPTICSGISTNLTFALPAGTYDVVYTDGTTNFNANGIANNATVSVSPTSTTTYTIVSVTNVATLCTSTAPSSNITGSAVVTVNPSPTLAVLSVPGTSTICTGSSANLIVTITGGTSPYSITLDNGIGTINNYSSGAAIPVSPVTTTTYNMVGNVTDASGCSVAGSGTATVTVNQPPTSAILSVVGLNTICSGTGANLTVTITGGTSPYTININNGVGIIGNYVSGTPIPVNPTVTTTYAMVGNITDAAGCTVAGSGSALITVNPSPTAAVLSVQGTSTVCAGSSANLIVTITGGTSPYSITLDNGIGTINNYVSGTAIPVSPGTSTTYNMVGNVTDALGCTVAGSGTAIITVNTPPTSAILSVVGPSTICSGTGANLAVTIIGGTSPYTININNGVGTIGNYVSGTPIPINPAATTTYAMVGNVTDAAGCTVAGSGSALVTVNPSPTAAVLSVSGTSTICAGSSANLIVTITGGTSPYTITLNNGIGVINNYVSGTPIPVSPAATTTYNMVGNVTDALGCTVAGSGSAPVTVNIPPASAVLSLSGVGTVCSGTGTTLIVTITGGTSPYTININNAVGIINNYVSGTPIPVSPAATTTYAMVGNVTDAAGCTVAGSGSALVTVNPSPTAAVLSVPGTSTICAGSNANLIVTITGGTSPYSITLNNGIGVINNYVSGTPIPVNPASTTTYNLVGNVSDASGCTVAGSGTATISVNPAPTNATLSVVGSGSICTGSSANLTVTITGGTSPYTINIDNGVGTINNYVSGTPILVNPAATTTYAMVGNVTDASGCTVAGSGSALVTVSPNPTISLGPILPICAGVTSVDLPYLGTTGTPNQYSIDFNGAAQTQGFVDVVNATLPPSPISIPVLATADPGTYNANLFVRSSTSGCLSAPIPITITITTAPTAAISGTTTICSGSSTNLTVNFTGTGPWSFTYSDGTTTSAPVNSPFNSFVIPVAPTATTTYSLVSVSDASVCPGTVSGTAVVTVSVSPLTNLAVDVTIDPLCSGGTTDVTVANSQVGVSYQLRNDAGDVPVGAPVAGTGATINLPSGVLTANTTFNVLATATGCTAVELTNVVSVTVAGAVNGGLSVTAAVNPLCSGNSTVIQIANSENGVLYQLRNDAGNSNIGAVVPGDGGTIDLPTGNLAATTTFNVLASNGTCSIELTDIETVTVSPSADPSLAVTVTLTPLCVGGSTTITVALSQTGISYQLRNDAGDVPVGAPIVGTGGTIVFPTGALAATTTFNVLATVSGCPPVELTSLAVVTVSGNVDATLMAVAAASPICQGTGTNIQIAGSEIGVTYQLRNDVSDASIGVPVAGNGGTILLPTGNLAATTTFNVLASNGTCSIELTDLETVNVDVAPNSALLVDVSLDPLCVGGVSSVTVALSQVGVTYQLRDDSDDSNVGAVVVGTGGTISFPTGVLNATTVFNILATSGICPAVQLTTLATVNVAGSLNAGLTVASSASSICAGTSTFIQVQTSENGVNYQLRNDLDDSPIGSPVVGTGGTINLPTGNISINTTFNVVASNGTCSIELTDTENVTIVPGPAINLTVNATATLICSGVSTNIVITASETGVSYQLRNNVGNAAIGIPVVGTGGNILLPTGTLTANTTFNILATIGSCSAQLAATPTVTIRPLGDPACGGGGPSDCANFAAIVPTIVTQPSCNDRDAGEVSFAISRADATPTTFRVIWTIGSSTQTKFTSNTVSFNDLSSGAYQYTIIDEGNGRSCGPVDFFLDLQTQVEILDKEVTGNVTCFGGTDGNAILTVDGSSTGEYWYKYVLEGVESSAQTFTPGAPLPGGLPADDDDFIIIKVDESFNFTCPDTVMVRIRHTFAKIDFTVSSSEVTTCNGTDGSILVSSIGGGNSGSNPLQVRLKKAVPFTTDPSGYAVLIDFEDVANGVKEYMDLTQGNYVVDVQDELGCIQSKPIAVQAPGQVPLASVSITTNDNTACLNEGPNGSITIVISDAGQYEVAVSLDPADVPAEDQFVDYSSPSFPNVTFNDLTRGAYYVYLKSSTTTCPTRTDVINIDGFQGLSTFDVLSNCENPNLTINNITGQADAPFVIRVFDNDDQFFKIDSLTSSNIPLSRSVTFVYSPPLQHSFLSMPGSYRFVMVQTQTFGTSTCTLVSDTVVYKVSLGLNITLGEVKRSFPEPKRTGSIEIADIDGGTRFVSGTNELYYEVALYDADDDIVIDDWSQVKLDPQNKFKKLYEYLPPGVYRIKVRDASGCEKTIDAEITLDPSVYIPNIFTPNDDSVNDEFEVMNLPLTGQHKLIVSNRWGNEVFKSGDYREGTFWNASDAADGIYFYRLQVAGGDTYTGWVEVLRGSEP